MGVLLAFGAAMFFSLSHVTVRRGVSQLGVPLGTALMLVLGMLTVCFMGLVLDGPLMLFTSSWTGIGLFAAAGIIHFLGGWGFMNASARLIGAARMSAVVSLAPLFATALAFVVLHEGLTPVLIGGILAVVVGIYLIATG